MRVYKISRRDFAALPSEFRPDLVRAELQCRSHWCRSPQYGQTRQPQLCDQLDREPAETRTRQFPYFRSGLTASLLYDQLLPNFEIGSLTEFGLKPIQGLSGEVPPWEELIIQTVLVHQPLTPHPSLRDLASS